MLSSVCAVMLLSAAPSADVRLEALVATSGSGADAILDGNAATGWSPEGQPGGEGVLLRFDSPRPLTRLELRACEGAGEITLHPYFNGGEAPTYRLKPEKVVIPTPGVPIRSIFLKMEGSPKGKACLGEVAFVSKGEPLSVKPPRRLGATVKASSTLKPEDAYHVGYLFDDRTDFGWVEGSPGIGEGESITLTLKEPVTLKGFQIWNGYQRSEDHFKKNARAASLEVSIDGKPGVTLALKDQQGPQALTLPAPAQAKEIRISVVKATKGTKYPDLVISELRLVDDGGALSLRTPDMEERQAALKKEVQGHPLADWIDREFLPVCDEAPASAMKLRSNHTFVAYETEDIPSEPTEVLDGAWIIRAQATPWSTLELFGRRHRTETQYEPYGNSKVKDSVRIAGGTVNFARVSDLGEDGLKKLVDAWSDSVISERVKCLGDLHAQYPELVKRRAMVVKGTTLAGVFWTR